MFSWTSINVNSSSETDYGWGFRWGFCQSPIYSNKVPQTDAWLSQNLEKVPQTSGWIGRRCQGVPSCAAGEIKRPQKGIEHWFKIISCLVCRKFWKMPTPQNQEPGILLRKFGSSLYAYVLAHSIIKFSLWPRSVRNILKSLEIILPWSKTPSILTNLPITTMWYFLLSMKIFRDTEKSC